MNVTTKAVDRSVTSQWITEDPWFWPGARISLVFKDGRELSGLYSGHDDDGVYLGEPGAPLSMDIPYFVFSDMTKMTPVVSPWLSAPGHADWAVMAPDGRGQFWDDKPIPDLKGNRWIGGGQSWSSSDWRALGFPRQWHASLHRRPAWADRQG